jgi:iron complex transport system substrate-binding protein
MARPVGSRLVIRAASFVPVLLLVSTVACAGAVAERIASLAPNLTELTFSAGAGDRLVATVAYSDHPDAARSIPRIGDAFRVDLERLLALRPDAVLAWTTGTPLPTIERIRSLGLRVVPIETNRLDDIAEAVRSIGRLAGTGAVADAVAARFERDVGALRARYRGRSTLRVFLQVNERPLYTVNGRQIMSEIVELCGGSNVFADLNELAPSIGVEAVIAANPQVILATGDTVRDAAGSWSKWPYIEAVRTGNVYSLPADDIARATTRLLAGAREICRTLDTARQRLRASSNR